jgi:hypothetical protein
MEGDDLDMSWIEEEERLQNIQTNYSREPMESIKTYFIYINKNQYIDKILCEIQELEINSDSTGSHINKETILKIIQTKKISTPFSKYKLVDILLYNIDLEPEHIQDYSKANIEDNSNKDLLKKIPIFDEVTITPSIFIFHGINSLYFIFQEVEIEKVKPSRHSLKSILKLDSAPRNLPSTKKVRIRDESIEYSDNQRSKRRVRTKKNMHSLITQ